MTYCQTYIYLILPETIEVHYSIELWTLRTLNILQLTFYSYGSPTCPLESDFVREKWCLSYINDMLSNIHIILPETMEVHYSMELWTLRTLNILQSTYYWY